ncbi:hypothetical protein [Sporosarcina sp. SAFN-010]|uniref:hypothetical protein n=1 Tax=Sporosarcina sp. SAFN-010 TaxID=3387273 RepID=UPI003F814426
MDYEKFFADVIEWIHAVNQKAGEHGMESKAFWDWIIASSEKICERHGNAKLALLQMAMMFDWLDEVYAGRG